MLPDGDKTKEQLSAELAALRLRIAELEQIEAEHKQADEELPRYDYLDGLVGERTAELKALNWHLQQQITEREKAEQALERTSKDLQLVSLINNAANQGYSLPKILQLVVQETKKIFSCDGATFYAISEDKKYLIVQNLTLPKTVTSQIERLIGVKIPAVRIRLREGSLYSNALQAGRPQLINDPETIQGLMAECTENKLLKKLVPRIHQLLGIASVMHAPLISEGEVIGLLDISRRRPFTELELERFTTIAQQLLIVLKRKQAEQALRENEHYLRKAQQIAGFGSWVLDVKTNRVEFSDEMFNILGITKEQFDGTPEYTINLVIPEDRARMQECYEDLLIRHKPVSMEYSFIRPDGSVRHHWGNGEVDFDEEGNPQRLVGTVLDITERKRAEEVLRESEAKYKTIFENVNDVIVRLDKRGKIIDANQRIEDYFGYKPEEIIGKNFTKLGALSLKDLPKVVKLFSDRVKGKPLSSIELEVKRKDGSTAILEANTTLIKKDGKIEGTVAIIRDITERKKTEEVLRESEHYLRKAQQIAHFGSWVLDVKTNRVEFSDEMFNILGITKEQFDGTPEYAINLVIPEDRARVQECNEDLLVRHEPTSMEYSIIRPDGSVRHLWGNGEVDFDEEGNPQRLVGTVLDITERKQAEGALRDSENEIRTITDNVPGLVSRLDSDGCYKFVNKRYEEWYGIQREEIIGKHCREILGEATYEQIKDYLNKVLTGHEVSFEAPLPLKYGGTRWVTVRYIPDFSDDGKVRGFFVLVTDITERKQAEEEIRASEEKYRELAESITDIFFAFDKDLRYTYWNKASEELIGISAEDALGKHLYDVFPDNEMTKKAEKVYRQVLKTKKPQYFINDYNIGGKDYCFEISAYPSEDGLSVFVRDITERKQAEEKLRENEEFSSSLLENLPNQIFVLYPDTSVKYVNPAFEKLTGFTLAEIAGSKAPHPWWPEEKREEMLAGLKDAMATGGRRSERIFQKKNGERFWVALNSAPVVHHGELIYFLINWVDITERKQAEEKHQIIVKTALDGFWIVNLGGKLLEVNDSYCQMIGYTQEEMLKMSIPDVEAVESHEDTIGHIKKVMEQGFDLFESRHKRKDGRIIDVEVNVNYVDVEEGQLFVFLRDITERKRVEGALRESEEKYRGLVTNVRSGVFRSTPEPTGKFLAVNPAMEEITGYSREELLEMDVADLYVNQEERKVILEEIASGKGKPTKETRLKKKDGTEIVVSDTKVAVRDYGGEVIYFDGIMEDITERKQAEEREKALQEELNLASRLAAVGELAAGVAHEMNNPLTGILGFSERLSRKSTDDDTKESLELIHYEAQRLAKVVKNLLTFARRREPKKEYADINDILQKTLDLRAYELKTGNIEVALELAANLPQIMVDFHQIQEVFVNIILNAEQVMTEASGGGKLTIKTRQIKDYIRISFTDDGPGIPARNLGKVFNPFFTTKGERGGTGLGLSVCHGIVTEHGGRIYARSRPGSGATFLVDLPLTSSQTGESQTAKEQLAV